MSDTHIRNELTARIGLVDSRFRTARPDMLAREIDDIRRLAHRSGMRPVVVVAQALEMALARGERGPLVQNWLGILRDAVGSERHDDAACETFRAACAVRMFG